MFKERDLRIRKFKARLVSKLRGQNLRFFDCSGLSRADLHLVTFVVFCL